MIREGKSPNYIAAPMPFRVVLMLVTAALLVMPAAAAAQDGLPRLEPGVRARLTLQDQPKQPFVGNVTFSTQHMIGVVRNGDTVNVARGELRQIDVSRGMSAAHGAAQGAKWGALVGAVFGIGAFALSPDDPLAGLGLVFGVGSGVLWGSVLGALIGSERWETRWEQPVR